MSLRGPPTDELRPHHGPVAAAGQAAEHLKVKLRPDLIVQPQFYEGMTHYVIKDPIALKYFRFKVEEYFLLQQFDGKQTLQDVKRVFERKYRPQTITVDDLLRFASQLHEAGIALIDSPRPGAGAGPPAARRTSGRRLWQFFANILYIKIPVVDPEKMLSGMYPYFRWIYTSWFIAFSVGDDARRPDAGGQPVSDVLEPACPTSRASSTGTRSSTSGAAWRSSRSSTSSATA